MIRGTVKIDIETCKGCELCIEACPQESLRLSPNINKQGYHYTVLVKDNCTGCVNCALVCPDAVITVYRELKKERKPIATVSQVTQDISVTVNELQTVSV
jgi:2-oxoglutarate ferredoxin oxidoreductase subunit delta